MITHKAKTILGDIPDDWATFILKDALAEERAGDWGDERGEVECRVLRSTNFTDEGHLDFQDVATRYLSQASADRLDLKAMDLLLERSGGGPAQPVGRIAFVRNDLPGHAYSNFVQRLRPDSGQVNPDYLGWVLFELNRSGIVERLQHQTTQMRNLEYRDYLRVFLPKPSDTEQQSIANSINATDDAVKLAHEELIAVRGMKTALMQQLFTKGIPGRHATTHAITVFRKSVDIPMTWEPSRLGSSTVLAQYGTNAASNDYRAGYPVIAIPQVVASRLELGDVPYSDISESEAQYLRLEENDVLLIRTNGNPDYMGKSTLVMKDVAQQHVVFASYLIRVRTKHDRLRGAYLNYFLASPLGRRQALAMANTSAGNHNLGARSLRQFWIPRPDPDEQDEIVDILHRCEDTIDALEDKATALLRLKKSLLQNLLTGRVHVTTGVTA